VKRRAERTGHWAIRSAICHTLFVGSLDYAERGGRSRLLFFLGKVERVERRLAPAEVLEVQSFRHVAGGVVVVLWCPINDGARRPMCC
jgi:hypothetical protein